LVTANHTNQFIETIENFEKRDADQGIQGNFWKVLTGAPHFENGIYHYECGYTTSLQLVKKILKLRGSAWKIKNYQMSPEQLKETG
jgi:hypothetical protein